MSVKFISSGSMFDSEAEVLVNPVNCIGVSGKGLAKVFRDRFPDNQAAYEEHCRKGYMEPGCVLLHVYYDDGLKRHRAIANFATKDHWKNPSRVSWIKSGLDDLIHEMQYCDYAFETLAVPALGCGLGGLDWRVVKPIIEDKLGYFEVSRWVGEPDQCEFEVQVEVYEPH